MKTLSNEASQDIVKSHSGNAWFETIDIEIPNTYVNRIKTFFSNGSIADPYAFISIFNYGESNESWHILMTNASTNVSIKSNGCVTFGSHSNYLDASNNNLSIPSNNRRDYFTCIGAKYFFSVPYKRENIDQNKDEDGFINSSITLGDTSGVIKKLVDICDGFSKFNIKLCLCMSTGNTNIYTEDNLFSSYANDFLLALNQPNKYYIKKTLVNTTTEAYDYEIEHDFYIGTCSHDNTNFIINICNLWPFKFRYPPRIAIKSRCQWNFKSAECGYAGNTYSSCSKTIGGCIQRNNFSRFGGFPGCGYGGLASK